MAGYQSIYDYEKQDKEAFWLQAAKLIDWIIEPKTALDNSNKPVNRSKPVREFIANDPSHKTLVKLINT